MADKVKKFIDSIAIRGDQFVIKKTKQTSEDEYGDEVKYDENSNGCPVCNKYINSRDRKVLNRTGMCMDCLVQMETNLRVHNLYEMYERVKIEYNEIDIIKDRIAYINELKRDINKKVSLTNSDGKQFTRFVNDKKTIAEQMNGFNRDLNECNLQMNLLMGEERTKKREADYETCEEFISKWKVNKRKNMDANN